jgi:hypothetical protein
MRYRLHSRKSEGDTALQAAWLCPFDGDGIAVVEIISGKNHIAADARCTETHARNSGRPKLIENGIARQYEVGGLFDYLKH